MEKAEKRWLVILVAVAVVFNATTLSPLVPWQNWLFWSPPTPVEEFHIRMKNYTFQLPPDGITVQVGEPVRFIVTSEDVTYGFGVFREDGSIVFQMQVLPGYRNSILWVFDEPGDYTIRSTEYSGPYHPHMVLPNAIRVVE
ncbi:hypothetical protein [Candidatus Hecatella orcuttiae]|uniref:hypothetical protein n=1 Tax=Candidatus Hecatella orcuttiae TaxID=1935119 RepID=UPI002867EE0E|nr:hypothetical protein [Candidatus Hecatella orcuttiae]